MASEKPKSVDSAPVEAEDTHTHAVDHHDETPKSDAVGVAAAIGVVVVGAAVIEVALVPAILVGAAAALAPKYLPNLGERMKPLMNSTVRGAVKLGRKARSAVNDAKERIGDISAEVHAEEAAAASR